MWRRMRAALSRVRELFRSRAHAAAEQSEEFAFHVEMETAENVRRGMSEAEAHRAALLRTLFATILPARRAARTHPASVLRGE